MPEFPGDSVAPIFFFSYARSTSDTGPTGAFRDPNQDAHRLFYDVSRHVAELAGKREGEPGFLDDGMGGGEDWPDTIREAVGTCQVFVALLSPTYPSREFCGWEWNAFERREVKPRRGTAPANRRSILPVVWIPGGVMPHAIGRTQRFRPKHLVNPSDYATYEREGLYGLLQIGALEVYNAVAWRLAQEIVQLAGLYHTAVQVPADPTELVNPFEEEAP